MYLVQILLPLFDNDGHAFEAAGVRAASFGARRSLRRGHRLHASTRSRGLERRFRGTTRDDIVIFEVMTGELDREWWTAFRKQLEARFRQDTLIVRALTSTVL